MEHFVIYRKSVGGRVYDQYFRTWDNARAAMEKDVTDCTRDGFARIDRRFDRFDASKGFYVYEAHGTTCENEPVIWALLDGYFQD